MSVLEAYDDYSTRHKFGFTRQQYAVVKCLLNAGEPVPTDRLRSAAGAKPDGAKSHVSVLIHNINAAANDQGAPKLIVRAMRAPAHYELTYLGRRWVKGFGQ